MKPQSLETSCFVRSLFAELVAAAVFFFFSIEVQLAGAEGRPKVHLNTSSAAARSVETATESSLVRDYATAWQNLSDALDFNTATLLDAYFVGPAKKAFADAVAGQQNIGIHSRFVNQEHRLETVFYAPEGDLMELHDTMTCELQVLDRDKTIHSEQVTLRYVVLMTPGADRWAIRQLQAVPKF